MLHPKCANKLRIVLLSVWVSLHHLGFCWKTIAYIRPPRIWWTILIFSSKNKSIWDCVTLCCKMTQNNLGVSKNSWFCLPDWRCWLIYVWSYANVDRIYLAINLVLFLFPKLFKHIGIYKKHTKPTNRILFKLNYLLNWLLNDRMGPNQAHPLATPTEVSQ